MELIDTHCHIHEISAVNKQDVSVAAKWQKAGLTNASKVIASAKQQGVGTFICVGTTVADSQLAINFVADKPNCYASIGVHPHEAKDFVNDSVQVSTLLQMAQKPKVVAVGECGLDYFYDHSPKVDQIKALELQLQLAQDNDLPVVFHIRNAFDDFWPVYDNFNISRGVVHSFTAKNSVLQNVLKRGLFVGFNGIITFTKESYQLEMAQSAPLASIVLETDAPFLTPTPFRGKICKPEHVVVTAEFLSKLRGESLQEIANTTTRNAKTLFQL